MKPQNRTAWLLPDPASATAQNAEDNRCARHADPARPIIIEQLIRACTRPGELVVDAFPSDETVMALALAHGRTAVGCAPRPKAFKRLSGLLTDRHPGQGVHELGLRSCPVDRIHEWLPEPAASIGLVLVELPEPGNSATSCPDCMTAGTAPDRRNLQGVIGSARIVLRPGGVLAVISSWNTANPGDITGGHMPGRPALSFSHHITVLRAADPGQPGGPPPWTDPDACPPQLGVQGEIHLFTQPSRDGGYAR